MFHSVTRREFTKRAVVTGAAMATARSAVAAVGANEKIRVGVIGCRTRGHQVASTFAGTGRFEIVSLCDCDAAMLDQGMTVLDKKLPHPPRPERDFRRLLDDKGVDVIVNATPDHWHALITVLALQAGKHVYVEKPACYNVRDGQAMVAAARRYPKLVVQVGSQQRSGPHFLEAKAFIAEGGLGKVGFARGWFTTDRGVVPIVPDGAPPEGFDYDLWVGPAPYRPFNEKKVHYNWHFVRDYGTGDLGNWGAHWLDSIRQLLDLDVPRAVMATGGTYVVRDAKEFPDTQTVLYEYPHLTLAWELREWSPFPMNGMGGGIEIRGEKGALTIDRSGWTFHPHNGQPQRHKGTGQEVPHALNFADCIAGAARPAASIEQGVKTCVLIHLGNIATFTKRRLEWDADKETIANDAEAARMLGREYRAPWTLPSLA
ncbi:MAG TPA: Gfo/Idh/MocA family oxidoreductase [Phycisphaerae bacterium]|jgi:predicted dehydrogenase|nr:Gfo/Idh/MocA family oxidoreductase [Phycisphaerae bacterium]HOB75062.1 Gfo/Idh/MocA family oxidoreductase [Phycisphaerae bacterium]HOJ53221.1 Gfo/Idh/MocA family oxidoreductase [Phycisphaerae bacterium]HOL25185.1 Gfo/Idh/MocA family oxidoreductase [Phycisphaerae bacterium]HPP20261.1 Gfo/Idh/MocA family oxidoreductase [Phycisphaerae bacterium]